MPYVGMVLRPPAGSDDLLLHRNPGLAGSRDPDSDDAFHLTPILSVTFVILKDEFSLSEIEPENNDFSLINIIIYTTSSQYSRTE